MPSVRYSGLRYFSHSKGGSTTWLSPSNTTKSLVAIRVAVIRAADVNVGCIDGVNLYDWYVGMRGNRVAQLWPITARGAVC